MSSEKKSILLFETIRVSQFKACNLDFHIRRANASSLSGLRFDLASQMSVPNNGLFRVKIIYDENGNFVEKQCFEYKKREIKSIRLLSSDISYNKKYLDRSNINSLFAKRGNCDEIIIVKNGLVTDTSIANIAIRSSGKWFTPRKPLLKGTTRQRLIEQNGLLEKDISIDEFLKAEKIALMNAMIGFYELENLSIEKD
ncbi:MAG: aminotransferase class IV [Bacteroidales bacterium]|jgi:4-amino-4-deoxychorismate lyase